MRKQTLSEANKLILQVENYFRAKDLGHADEEILHKQVSEKVYAYANRMPKDPCSVPMTAKEKGFLGDVFDISDYSTSYANMQNYTGLTLAQCRRYARALARKGYIKLYPWVSEDDGLAKGSGYALTTKGEKYMLEKKGKEE